MLKIAFDCPAYLRKSTKTLLVDFLSNCAKLARLASNHHQTFEKQPSEN